MSKTNEAEYDPSLTQFLIDNGFSSGNLPPLIPANGSLAYAGPSSEMMLHIYEIKAAQQTGCIFTLPAKGFFPNYLERIDWTVVFYTPISSNEIRRRVALKAFL